MRAHAAGESEVTRQPVIPVTEPPVAESARITASLLEARDAHRVREAAAAAKPKRTKIDPAERAATKAAVKAAELAARIAEAAGAHVALPAVVTRDGAVRPIALSHVPELLAGFGALDALTVDVETTGYPIGHADYALRTIQLGNEHAAVVLAADDHAHRVVAANLLSEAAKLHAHSASADLVPLDAVDVVAAEAAWAKMHDTVIPALLADPQSTGSDADGLKELARDVLGARAVSPGADEARAALFKAGRWLKQTKVTTPLERSGWAQADSSCTTMVRYAASDVLDTAALARALPDVPPAVLERERTAQRMTARVAHRGLAIDGEHVEQMLARVRPELVDAAERLRSYGVDNPGSDQQVAAVAAQLGASLPRTATGRLSVAAGALEPLRAADGPLGDFVRARLGYQKAETALGTFLEPYHQLVTRGDGRARPTVYTLGADTGRMSCVRPNLQQVPREGGYRACITADLGELLISADFSGVEIRVAAALSGDPNLRQMLEQGVDLHWQIARQVYGPDATKSDRYSVKRGVFGRFYGGGIPTLARQMGVSESIAAAVVETLDAMTPGLTAWSRSLREAVKAGHTQFPTYAGRVIHLRAPHAAANYCIQGTARELLIDTLIRWQATPWGNCTLLPVHDEIVAAVPAEQAEAATAALVACMETELFGVRIKAEASRPSFAWSDAA